MSEHGEINIPITQFGGPPMRTPMPLPALAGPLIGGAATLLGGILANRGVRSQNTANRRMAERQMAFQREMSDTAMQRQVKDLRLAGLNPILAATRLGGASTPGGATAQMMDELGPAVHSAQQVSRTMAELRNLQATNELIKAQTGKTQTETVGLEHDLSLRRVRAGIIDRGESAATRGADILGTAAARLVEGASNARQNMSQRLGAWIFNQREAWTKPGNRRYQR